MFQSFWKRREGQETECMIVSGTMEHGGKAIHEGHWGLIGETVNIEDEQWSTDSNKYEDVLNLC